MHVRKLLFSKLKIEPTSLHACMCHFIEPLIGSRGVNDILLAVYPIRIVSDKMCMSKILFSLDHWIRKKFR
jgi:hypothetical protein